MASRKEDRKFTFSTDFASLNLTTTEVNRMVGEARLAPELRGVTWGFATTMLGLNPFHLRTRPNRPETALIQVLSVWAKHYKNVGCNPHEDKGMSFLTAAKVGASPSKVARIQAAARRGTANAVIRDMRALASQTDTVGVDYNQLAKDIWFFSPQTRSRFLRDAYIYTTQQEEG